MPVAWDAAVARVETIAAPVSAVSAVPVFVGSDVLVRPDAAMVLAMSWLLLLDLGYPHRKYRMSIHVYR